MPSLLSFNDMTIQTDGIIREHLRGVFVVVLPDQDDHRVLCKPSGKMRQRHITLVVGDHVKVELSPYDLSRGRIVWRM